jgi:YD repeat-containing protein
MRSVWGSFPEYHSSADNLDFIRPLQLAGSLRVCASILDVLEKNRSYRNLNPCCEPQLGRRNLYRSVGGDMIGLEINARLWVLNLSDGEHSLLDIAERSGIRFSTISEAADLLCESGLLAVVPCDAGRPTNRGEASHENEAATYHASHDLTASRRNDGS